MGHAISFPCASVAGQREDRGLSKEVHSGCVLVEIREDGSERLARMQLLRRLRVLGIHVHDEVRV